MSGFDLVGGMARWSESAGSVRGIRASKGPHGVAGRAWRME